MWTMLPSTLCAEELRLLSSIEPVNKLVAEIAGEQHSRAVLWRKNQSVHSVSFKPSQIRAVAEADLIFWVGPMLETPLAALLESKGLHGKSVRLATPRAYYLKHGKGVREDVCVQDWHECDPHIWFGNADVMAEEITKAFLEHDPDNAELYNRNFELFKEKSMQSLLGKVRRGRQSPKNILALHNGWQYLGVQGYEIFSEHGFEYIGAKSALELERKLKTQNVDCVLVGPMTRLALLENILSDVDQRPPLLILDPMGSDYPADTSFFDYLELSRQSIRQCKIVLSITE